MDAFPARFAPEPEGGFTVTFRDVPEAITWGASEVEAMTMAVDALETAFSFYVERNEPLPRPSAPRRAERMVAVSPLGTAKAALYTALREKGIAKKELARRLGCHPPQIERLLDFTHHSRWPLMQRALAALGLRLVVEVRDAA